MRASGRGQGARRCRPVRHLMLVTVSLGGLLGVPATPASAQRHAVIGIHEARPEHIRLVDRNQRSLWPGLRVHEARAIFPWNVALMGPTEPERLRLEDWLRAVRDPERGVQTPLVTLNVGGRRPRRSRRLGEWEYRRAFTKFINRYGPNKSPWNVTLIAPWNEPNRMHPRAIMPVQRAVRFFGIAQDVCPHCKLVAGEFAGSTHFTNRNYIKRYLSRVRRYRPEIFGIHTQGDVQRFQICRTPDNLKKLTRKIFPNRKRKCAPRGTGERAAEIRQFLALIRPRFRRAQLWVTEVDAYLTLLFKNKVPLSWDETQQCEATAFIQSFPNLPGGGAIKRIYFNRFVDPPPGRNDTGLITPDPFPNDPQQGEPKRRRAYRNIAARQQRCGAFSSAFTGTADWISAYGAGSDTQIMADPTGDGRADAVVYFGNDGSWHVAPSDGGSFATPTRWITGHGIGSDKQMLDDVDGDDAADAVVYFARDGSWYVAPSTKSAFRPFTRWISGHGIGAHKVTLSDVTGDGRSDAIAYFDEDGSWYVAPSTGSSFAPFSRWISGHGIGSSEQMMDDVDGDDLPDAVVYFEKEGAWYVALSTGTTFQPYSQWIADYGIGSTNQVLDDVNGDGAADAITIFEESGDWYVAQSTGSSFAPLGRWLTGFGAGRDTRRFVADATGDDKGDAAAYDPNTGSWQVTPATP